MRSYPTRKVSSAPGTGHFFYKFLLENAHIPAQSSHIIWYSGMKHQLENPDESAFRGGIPKGETLDIVSVNGTPVESPYTFTGDEGPILVSDLSDSLKSDLNIPSKAKLGDKV